MSWKKHFNFVNKNDRVNKIIKNSSDSTYFGDNAVLGKYSSYLPEYYAGSPQRLQRYKEYDFMDMDSEINTSLDIIADFCTQQEEQEKTPFNIEFIGNNNVTETEIEIINSSLVQWTRLNEFNRKLWTIFRSAIKYGDCFFVRDPETFKWIWIDPNKVQAIIVNAAEGKEPEEYIVNEIDFKIAPSILTEPNKRNNIQSIPTQNTSQPQNYNVSALNNNANSSIGTTVSIKADSIVHLSLTEGMDNNWPFGNSILESVFKVFKQKELLEDSIIIYRVQRAPERRVFYIDTGEMPPHKAMAFVERIKNEVHQKRIPNRTGGGSNIMDAAFDPLAIVEDYFFSTSPDGRGSKVDTLPGGDGINNINDLEYFDDKLKRGLGIPPSYLPSTDEGAVYNDGRIGSAFMQEYRFAKYCKRLQMLLSHKFDRDFKLYLKKKDLNIDSSMFELRLHEPQSFAKYRQIEIDSAQINVYQPIASVPHISKRFALKRYLNWTDDEILENERMWQEENQNKVKSKGADAGTEIGIDSVGIRSPGGEGFDFGDEEDLGDEGEFDFDNESPISGGEQIPPDDTGNQTT